MKWELLTEEEQLKKTLQNYNPSPRRLLAWKRVWEVCSSTVTTHTEESVAWRFLVPQVFLILYEQEIQCESRIWSGGATLKAKDDLSFENALIGKRSCAWGTTEGVLFFQRFWGWALRPVEFPQRSFVLTGARCASNTHLFWGEKNRTLTNLLCIMTLCHPTVNWLTNNSLYHFALSVSGRHLFFEHHRVGGSWMICNPFIYVIPVEHCVVHKLHQKTQITN